jgi:hypothetical protein
MSTLTGPGADPVPLPGDPARRRLETLADVTEAVLRANHLTGPAAWLVAMSVLAWAFTLPDLGSASAPSVTLLLALMLPVPALAFRAVLLLARAARAGAEVGGEPRWSAGASTDEPPTAEQVWDRLHQATTAVQLREVLARRALAWAVATTSGTAAWIALTLVITPGRHPGG